MPSSVVTLVVCTKFLSVRTIVNGSAFIVGKAKEQAVQVKPIESPIVNPSISCFMCLSPLGVAIREVSTNFVFQFGAFRIHCNSAVHVSLSQCFSIFHVVSSVRVVL